FSLRDLLCVCDGCGQSSSAVIAPLLLPRTSPQSVHDSVPQSPVAAISDWRSRSRWPARVHLERYKTSSTFRTAPNLRSAPKRCRRSDPEFQEGAPTPLATRTADPVATHGSQESRNPEKSARKGTCADHRRRPLLQSRDDA